MKPLVVATGLVMLMLVIAIAEVHQDQAKPACAATNNAALHISKTDSDAISTVVFVQHDTVPAGTIADMFMTNYDGQTAKGSIIYHGDFGSYNFYAVKATNNAGFDNNGAGLLFNGWQVASITSCQPIN